jgi:SAM-dependent methyltransferase
MVRNFVNKIFRLIFYLLYHPFAWTYDWVAELVSCGKWQDWVSMSLPYLPGPRVLELGHGPGHLQVALKRKGISCIGVDASRQMSGIAHRRLRRAGYSVELINGYAQKLPFAPGSFSQIVATFPSEYIFEEQTLMDVYRILTLEGKLVVIMGGWLSGQGVCQRLVGWLLGSAAQHKLDHLQCWLEPFHRAGFSTEGKIIDLVNSQVFLILASK